MKICVICVEKTDYAPKRIMQEGKKRGHEMYITSWLDVVVKVDKNKIYIGDNKKDFKQFDAIIPRSPSFSLTEKYKKNIKKLGTILKLIIEYSKDNNFIVLNDKYFTHYQSLDKLSQQYFFFKNNLPGIPTKYFSRLPEKISFPIISKTAQGSLGSGVFMTKNQNDLKKIIEDSNTVGKNFIYQKYYPISYDYRILVVDKKAMGVMKRISSGNEWRTNVSLGGEAHKFDAPEAKKIKYLAEKVAKKMLFDYVGVDILEHQGNYHIIEVNSLAQFEGFEKAYSNMNVAGKLIEFVEKKMKKEYEAKTNNKR
ncbi:MAG: ATP-grasp domain-containing protein [bacterium]|nr:ATP-grasp domain-containing protein [bacterium]